MGSPIEAIYIFDQRNEPILEHSYRRCPSARVLLPLYIAHPPPRPPVLYLPNTNPPIILFSVIHSHLLFLVPSSKDVEPLAVLEFLHRLCDVLEEFLGAPLLASKIESSYEIVAQLLGEMCDAGNICTTEPNALKDVVDMPGWMDKLLGGVGLPGTSPALAPPGALKQQQLALTPASLGPAIPWRRANVRHTSNELYVDIVETLSVTLAPSGKPLAARANGSILFTSKLSGVPDLLLALTVPSGKHTVDRVLELPTFHPCVRLSRWKEKPGELSFVPPDGKFLLAGYEVNLLPAKDIKSVCPASIEVSPSLGATGLEFEVRLLLSTAFATGAGASSSGQSTPSFFGVGGGGASSSAPVLRDIIVSVPVPPAIRNVTDLRSSRGEATFAPADHLVEWRISTKEAAGAGSATLRCTVVGPLQDEVEGVEAASFGFDAANGSYDEEVDAYQASGEVGGKAAGKASARKEGADERDEGKVGENSVLMPRSAAVSFSVKGWTASGIKVESLNIDLRKSRGLGEGVKPVKGVKYLTVSRKGVETRC